MTRIEDIERRLEGIPGKTYVFHCLLSRETLEATRDEIEEYAEGSDDFNPGPVIHTLQANRLVGVKESGDEPVYTLTDLGEEYLETRVSDFDALKRQLRSARSYLKD